MLHTVRYGPDVWQDGAVTSSASASPSTTGRLTIDDWTERALSLLMDEGVGAIKIARLCRELGVTKGSFYWHFADLEALKTAVAKRWCERTRADLDQLKEIGTLPPLERIRIMAAGLVEDRAWNVERTLREWARTDPTVAATIGESEQHIFGLLNDAFLELGHPAGAARMRAGLLTYAGIGFAHGQASLPRVTMEDIDDLVAFLSREVGTG
jgi:AcrR family transcriptional regulator